MFFLGEQHDADRTMPSTQPNLHLPPHLREVCDILAAGLVRLRSRDAQDHRHHLQTSRESSLHILPKRSMCRRRQHEDAA